MEQEDKIDKLAEMTAKEFAAIRGEMGNMATKVELNNGINKVLGAIEDLSLHVNAWMSDTEHRFKDMEQRMNVIESKVGLRR
ncbi:MAG: hypothetical protein AAB787_00605 [Patescibacteria group bacterium]